MGFDVVGTAEGVSVGKVLGIAVGIAVGKVEGSSVGRGVGDGRKTLELAAFTMAT